MTNRVTGFYFLFASQLLLIVAKIFMEVKVGLYSLAFTIVFLTITLIQLSNDEKTDWKRAGNGMLYLYSIWGVFYFLELFNPNAVLEAWNICLPPYALLPIICAALVPIVIRDIKGLEWLLYIWAAFILIATLKGYWQKTHGFSERDRYFLYVLGGWRTHIIWSGIRYFSCFSDAAIYGVHSAMAAVTFFISSFYANGKAKKLFFLFIALCAIYSFGISGTRSSIGVIAGGIFMFSILAKSKKAFLLSSTAAIALFCFFYFTNIGNGNPFIYKMRSAFHPREDMSYMVRVENRKRMKELMAQKPIGYGIGISKPGANVHPKEIMPYPPDSWLVSIWIETGIVGLVIYLLVNGSLFIWCSWILLFKVKDPRLRGLVAAWLCANAGFFLAAYAADNMQYPNPIVVYIGFALCFAAPHIDKYIGEQKAVGQLPVDIEESEERQAECYE